MRPGNFRTARGGRVAFRAWYADHLTDATIVYPQVAETLATLAERGWRMAVVTNKPDGWSQTIVTNLGLAEWLPVVIGGDGCVSLPLNRLAGSCGTWRDSRGFMDDWRSPYRSGAAVAAGVSSIWCPWGIGQQDGTQPDIAVTTPGQPDAVGQPAA